LQLTCRLRKRFTLAGGKNIIRGLISRGYSDTDVKKVTGGNALAFFRRVMS